MSIFSVIASLFKPAQELIDSLFTSEEEKAEARRVMEEIQNSVLESFVDLEKTYIEKSASVLTAEVHGKSWLQRNWRPVTMLTFLFVIVFAQVIAPVFSLDAPAVPDQMWPLLTIGIGGYIGGRSIEKIAPSYFRNKYGSE